MIRSNLILFFILISFCAEAQFVNFPDLQGPTAGLHGSTVLNTRKNDSGYSSNCSGVHFAIPFKLMHSPGFKMEKLFRFYELRKSMYVDPHSLAIFGEATRTNVYFDGIYQSNLSAKFGIQGHIYRHLHQFLFYKLQYVNNGFDTKKTSHFMEGYVGFAKRVTPGVIFF